MKKKLILRNEGLNNWLDISVSPIKGLKAHGRFALGALPDVSEHHAE